MNSVRTSRSIGRRLVMSLAALLMGTAVLASCQNVQAGARCNTTEFGQQGDWVLVCNNGHWERRKTKAEVVDLFKQAATGSASSSGNPGNAPTAGQPTGAAGHFSTLPVNAALPDGATCAGRVRQTAEVRGMNYAANHTPGTQKNLTEPYPNFNRVDGNFVGTTDELIQWAACKWGIDEDIVRAQAAIESYWDTTTVGDFQGDPSICVPGHPIGADGHAGQCPASGGLLSLTYQYYKKGFPEAMTSTAYNLDYVYAWWRACYTGQVTWMNTVDRGQDYAAGDAWGCVGAWFAGRWHTSSAEGYIQRVKDYLAQKVWTSAPFIARG